jgi:hypothetical protein
VPKELIVGRTAMAKAKKKRKKSPAKRARRSDLAVRAARKVKGGSPAQVVPVGAVSPAQVVPVGVKPRSL